jgi:hypothetical protein
MRTSQRTSFRLVTSSLVRFHTLRKNLHVLVHDEYCLWALWHISQTLRVKRCLLSRKFRDASTQERATLINTGGRCWNLTYAFGVSVLWGRKPFCGIKMNHLLNGPRKYRHPLEVWT